MAHGILCLARTNRSRRPNPKAKAMPHTHHASAESDWVSAGLILAALIYLRESVRIGRVNRDSLGGWRSASFTLALLFIWVAPPSPLDALDHDMLTAHMVQ